MNDREICWRRKFITHQASLSVPSTRRKVSFVIKNTNKCLNLFPWKEPIWIYFNAIYSFGTKLNQNTICVCFCIFVSMWLSQIWFWYSWVSPLRGSPHYFLGLIKAIWNCLKLSATFIKDPSDDNNISGKVWCTFEYMESDVILKLFGNISTERNSTRYLGTAGFLFDFSLY